MVGFLHNPTSAEDEKQKQLNPQPLDLKKSNDPHDLSFPQVEDFDIPFDFADSFLDFDSIKDLLEENPEPYSDMNSSEKVEFGVVESSIELGEDNFLEGVKVEDSIGDGSGKLENLVCLNPNPDGVCLEMAGIGCVERGVEMVKDEIFKEIKVEDSVGDGLLKLGNLGCLIEEVMEKVSLNGVSNSLVSVVNANGLEKSKEIVDGFGVNGSGIGIVNCDGGIENAVKNGDIVLRVDVNGGNSGGIESDEDESDSETESESVSSSSTSSSSEDDDDEEEGEEEVVKDQNGKDVLEGDMDLEEGEIRDSDADKMVGWSDDEEDGGGNNVRRGPIMSKNELEDLPPVPPVNVTLQPYHQTLPVGVVLSIVGTQIIVEGMDKHNPLNEGSILWISESRSPLGLVDEIFGPVKNPYYVVRYNSDGEVPPGIRQGTLISFVPEFANHVLNDKSLYKKGYDASGENDEEVFDGVEFSDDEKEAEHRRMQKMTKRGTNEQKSGNRRKDKKKFKNQGGNWKNDQPPMTQASAGVDQLSIDHNQPFIPPVTASLGHGNCPRPSGAVQNFAGGSSFPPTFPEVHQSPGFNASSNGVWTNAFFSQQTEHMGFTNGFPTNGMAWLQQNHIQQPQMPLPKGVPFQQQFNTGQGLPSNFLVPGGQSNFGAGPSFAPWPACLGQSGFNQPPFVMGLQGQHAFQTMNGGTQVPSNGLQMENPPPLSISGNNETSQKFRQGVHSYRGRKPYRRGSVHFRGERGRQQSN